MKVLVLTTVFNRREIDNLIASLEKQIKVEILLLIVDHGDHKLPETSSSKIKIEKINAGSHLWFSGALNVGLRHAKDRAYDYYLIINDDVGFDDNNFIYKLFEKIETDNRAVVSASCVNPKNGNFEYTSLKFKPLKCRYESPHKGVRKVEDIFLESDVLPTRCLAMHSSFVSEVGRLQEDKLPHYGSDYEWLLRGARSGFKLFSRTDCIVFSNLSSTLRHTVNGRKVYTKDAFISFWNDFFNIRKQNSITCNYNFATLVYGYPYALYFTVFRGLRTFIGFFFSNYVINGGGR